MSTSTSTESSRQRKPKLGEELDFEFSLLPETRGPEEPILPNKTDFSLPAALISQPKEDISPKDTYRKQGRQKERATLLLELFYRKLKKKKRGRGRKRARNSVKWADLRGKLVKDIRLCAICALGNTKPSTGVFKYSLYMEHSWPNVQCLIEENRLQFQQLLQQSSITPLTDPIFKALYREKLWKQLHHSCMQLLLGDQEPITLEAITSLSAMLNLHLRDNCPTVQSWMELRRFLLWEMVQNGGFEPYDYVNSLLDR